MLAAENMKYFNQVYEIYQEAFPDVERRPREEQMRVFADPRYHLRIWEEEKVMAFLGYWEFNSFLFLEHLAVRRDCRGNGCGRKLMEECIQEGKQKGKALILEIEPASEEAPVTVRREKFYHRLGFFTNYFPYEQQPYREGDQPISLWILSHPYPISEADFLPWKQEIYRTVYQMEG